ncbi:MAG: hypothetical protein LUB58_02215 [Oscillospiraceae bacterium]|nr:hypothetical protein [Oscillospiraceae bacterium]
MTSATVQTLLSAIKRFGLEVQPSATEEILAGADDLIFYEVAMGKRVAGSRLITGNKKHSPERAFIVTPAEMIHALDAESEQHSRKLYTDILT